MGLSRPLSGLGLVSQLSGNVPLRFRISARCPVYVLRVSQKGGDEVRKGENPRQISSRMSAKTKRGKRSRGLADATRVRLQLPCSPIFYVELDR